MPKGLLYAAVVLIVLALLPPALIAWARAVPSEKTRIHLIQDMDNQHKFRAQHANPIFADGRAMRPPVPGTVARGHLNEDEHYHRGVAGNQWAATFPDRVTVDRRFLERGRERFDIFCNPCHGVAGYGDGIIHQRAMQLVLSGINGTTWVQPKSIHEPAIRDQAVGQLYNSVTNGVRNMGGYGAQISIDDRWAIVAYVKALQRSQHAASEDLPADQRSGLPTVSRLQEGQNQ